MSALHHAALEGSFELTTALLRRRGFSIDQVNKTCMAAPYTPLMLAASRGHYPVVKILLDVGANPTVVSFTGRLTALHSSAQEGFLAVTKLLLKAGADPAAKSSSTGSAPLTLAAERGHVEVMEVLIMAGADIDTYTVDGGGTPLYFAARNGHVNAVRFLIRAKANPVLRHLTSLGSHTPLDAAAENGHWEVVYELIQEHGIEGCGGVTGGVKALHAAAQAQQIKVMEVLTSAGAVDTGTALQTAAGFGRESSVKFLLLQRNSSSASLENLNPNGGTALICSIQGCRPCSPRIMRLLVDAGADTKAAVRLTEEPGGAVIFDGTPLAYTNLKIGEKDVESFTESELHGLEANRRLLMRVEAVHAASWLWATNVPSVNHSGIVEEAPRPSIRPTMTTPNPLKLMLPILRRRTKRPRVLLAALFRNSVKP